MKGARRQTPSFDRHAFLAGAVPSLLLALTLTAILTGGRAESILERPREWLVPHGSVITGAVLVAIGVNLTGKGIAGLD